MRVVSALVLIALAGAAATLWLHSAGMSWSEALRLLPSLLGA